MPRHSNTAYRLPENTKSSLHLPSNGVQAAFLFGRPNRNRRIYRSRCCSRVFSV